MCLKVVVISLFKRCDFASIHNMGPHNTVNTVTGPVRNIDWPGDQRRRDPRAPRSSSRKSDDRSSLSRDITVAPVISEHRLLLVKPFRNLSLPPPPAALAAPPWDYNSIPHRPEPAISIPRQYHTARLIPVSPVLRFCSTVYRWRRCWRSSISRSAEDHLLLVPTLTLPGANEEKARVRGAPKNLCGEGGGTA